MDQSVRSQRCACGRGLRGARSLSEGRCSACRSARAKGVSQGQARAAIQGLLERDDVLILDTETTSAGKGAEVIEVSVINTKGDVLLDTLVKPKVPKMNPFAQRVHGISLDMLADAPTWPEVLPELSKLADRRTVLAWNAPFDRGMLAQTSAAWNLAHPRWLFVCAMRLYAKKRGIKVRGLHKCVVDEQVEHLFTSYRSHRALGDIVFVLEVLRSTVKEPSADANEVALPF